MWPKPDHSFATPVSPFTGACSVRLLVVPSPSWPVLFEPVQVMVASGRNAHEVVSDGHVMRITDRRDHNDRDGEIAVLVDPDPEFAVIVPPASERAVEASDDGDACMATNEEALYAGHRRSGSTTGVFVVVPMPTSPTSLIPTHHTFQDPSRKHVTPSPAAISRMSDSLVDAVGTW